MSEQITEQEMKEIVDHFMEVDKTYWNDESYEILDDVVDEYKALCNDFLREYISNMVKVGFEITQSLEQSTHRDEISKNFAIERIKDIMVKVTSLGKK